MQKLKKYRIRTVGCFIIYKNKFLILHRKPEKSQGGKWGLPAGKVNKRESDKKAILREIREETGYKAKPKELEFLLERLWEFKDKIVEFPTYRLRLNKKIKVKHNPDEHQGYKWVTPKQCYKMKNLIHGFHDLLRILKWNLIK